MTIINRQHAALPPIRPIATPRFSLHGQGSQTNRNIPQTAPSMGRTPRLTGSSTAREGRVGAVLTTLERRRHLPEVRGERVREAEISIETG